MKRKRIVYFRTGNIDLYEKVRQLGLISRDGTTLWIRLESMIESSRQVVSF